MAIQVLSSGLCSPILASFCDLFLLDLLASVREGVGSIIEAVATFRIWGDGAIVGSGSMLAMTWLALDGWCGKLFYS